MKFTQDMNTSIKKALIIFLFLILFINSLMIIGSFFYYKNYSKAEQVAEKLLNNELFIVEELGKYLD